MNSFRSRKNPQEAVETPNAIAVVLARESITHSSTASDGESSDGSSTETPRTIIDEHNGFGVGKNNSGNAKHNESYQPHHHHHHRRHKGTHFGSFYLRMGCVGNNENRQ